MSSARRCLFGRPTPEQRSRTRTWLDDACKRMRKEESEKWGFDFELGVPLPDSQFIYDVLPESCVPEFYRSKILSATPSHSTQQVHVISFAASISTMDISSTTLTPLSSPSTSEREEPSLLDSSFEDEEEPKKWKFQEPSTPRKSPTKRQSQTKLTSFMPISRKKSSISPKRSPVNVIFASKSRPPTFSTHSPY